MRLRTISQGQCYPPGQNVMGVNILHVLTFNTLEIKIYILKIASVKTHGTFTHAH